MRPYLSRSRPTLDQIPSWPGLGQMVLIFWPAPKDDFCPKAGRNFFIIIDNWLAVDAKTRLAIVTPIAPSIIYIRMGFDQLWGDTVEKNKIDYSAAMLRSSLFWRHSCKSLDNQIGARSAQAIRICKKCTCYESVCRGSGQDTIDAGEFHFAEAG